GGTGSIGAPVVRALVGRGHHVIALARSNSSATKAASLGANPLGGDIAAAERWLPALPTLDAVVHLACDFGSDMVDVDRRLLDGLLPHLAAQPNQATFIYTGGCWLFGATGDAFPGLPVGRIARAVAQRFGLRDHAPQIVSADAIAAELGDWARGRAMDQQLSGEKARRELGWKPVHLDPEREIAALATDDD